MRRVEHLKTTYNSYIDDTKKHYHTKGESAAEVVHYPCCTSYLQQKRSTISPPIRAVRNEKGLTKSALAADPDALLSSSHHRSRRTRREKRYSPGSRTTAACCHRWKRQSRTTDDAIVSHAATIVLRAAAHVRGANVKARRWKRI